MDKKNRTELNINGRKIGEGHPAYIIAEMSANHSGSLERAKEIIHAAKESGADCIKIQTYTPDTLTIDCDNQWFRVQNGTWNGENLYGLYQKAYTPWEWQGELKEEAGKVGIDFLSTPFDRTSVDFLEDLNIDFYKIASFELVDLPLIRYVASKGKPMIMSTGMSTMEEIREALEAARSMGNDQVALLRCSSAYPADVKEMNLLSIQDMRERFQVPVGLSDHSMGHLSAVMSIALGGKIIEKHFCISRKIKNPDSAFSMEPEEFARMVEEVRRAEAARGDVSYGPTKQDESSLVFRRSIFVVKDMKKGEKFSEENTRIIRPGYGLKPKYWSEVIGLEAKEDIERGTPFSFSMTRKGKILFLTNNGNTNDVYEWLLEHEDGNVLRFGNKLTLGIVKDLEPSYIVSFNYRHIVPGEIIDYMQGRIINLHCSYLPFNKGASPNFFSFLYDTPKGVTIHRMDAGLDTGDILCQERIDMDPAAESFESSYDKLTKTISNLFCENWDGIKNGEIQAIPQKEEGSYHTMKELNDLHKEVPFEWRENVQDVLCRIGKR